MYTMYNHILLISGIESPKQTVSIAYKFSVKNFVTYSTLSCKLATSFSAF